MISPDDNTQGVYSTAYLVMKEDEATKAKRLVYTLMFAVGLVSGFVFHSLLRLMILGYYA